MFKIKHTRAAKEAGGEMPQLLKYLLGKLRVCAPSPDPYREPSMEVRTWGLSDGEEK